MTELSIQNDEENLILMIEYFEKISTLTFLTDVGKEFKNTMDSALEEDIKPYARKCLIELRNLKNQNDANAAT